MDNVKGFTLQKRGNLQTGKGNGILSLRNLENLTLRNSGRCWWCGKGIIEGSIWSDDNRHGMNLEDYERKQIVFFHCDSCGRNTSIQNAIPTHRHLLQLKFKSLAN